MIVRKKGYYSGFLQGNGKRLLAAGESVRIQFPVQMSKVRQEHFISNIEALEQELKQLKADPNFDGYGEHEYKKEIAKLEQELERLRVRALKV